MTHSKQSGEAGEGEALRTRITVDPTSPVFARLGNLLLQDGRVDEALGILERGLRYYPWYPTAHMVRARALAAVRRYGDARAALDVVEELVPDCPAADALRAAIVELEKSRPPLAPTAGFRARGAADTHFAPRERFRASRREDLIPGFSPSASQKEKTQPPAITVSPSAAPDGTRPAEEDKLERLVRELETAHIPLIPEEGSVAAQGEAPPDIDFHHRPATETLAEIYIGQGRYEEAVEVFLTLCARHPEMQDRWIPRIVDLRRLIDDSHKGS
ncbi:MAG: tetratricopeptide repeat protein [Bacteroidota bacterium]|nr:tetratricopeptide repeat protein [Bacteroidota bacterium]